MKFSLFFIRFSNLSRNIYCFSFFTCNTHRKSNSSFLLLIFAFLLPHLNHQEFIYKYFFMAIFLQHKYTSEHSQDIFLFNFIFSGRCSFAALICTIILLYILLSEFSRFLSQKLILRNSEQKLFSTVKKFYLR
jgi:hypothetical protein